MKIDIEATVAAPLADVWRAFNDPDDIVRWDGTSEWRVARASNDLTVGGLLSLRLERVDGGAGSDFAATYTRVEPERLIEWRDADGRSVRVEFVETARGVAVRQSFDADPARPEGPQRAEWQAVLDRLALHVESTATG